jgi:hypothetical protein
MHKYFGYCSNLNIVSTFYFSVISLLDILSSKKKDETPCNKPWRPTGLPHRIPYFPDSWLIDGIEVFSLTLWPPFTARKNPGTNSVTSIRNQTCDLPFCNIKSFS